MEQLSITDEEIASALAVLPTPFQVDLKTATPKQTLSLYAKIYLGRLLEHYFGVDLALKHFRKTEGGKPYLEHHAIEFNLSHSRNWLGIAIAPHSPVGIDVQVHKKFNPKITERVFCSEERAASEKATDDSKFFFDIWCKKEAAVKTTGDGIKVGLKTFSTIDNCAEIKNSSVHLQSIELLPNLSAAIGSTAPIAQIDIQKIKPHEI